MFGGTKRTSYIGGALLAACMFAAGSAGAADLGGGCCADLEERVAELEATTARKGNRVVSLQVSGTVNEALLAFDDGVDSDAYIVTNTGYQSRLNFIGTGQINKDWKAGFVITLGVFGSPSFAVDQTNDESISAATGARPDEIFIRESKVYLESERLGRLTLGQQGTAADDITAINVARSLYVDSSAQQVFVGGFRMRDGDALTSFRFLHLMGNDATNPPGDAARFDVIRYDSPSIAGFKVSASWGENDMWDVALRYAGLLGGRFKTAAGIAYGARTDGDVTATSVPGTAGSNINGCIIDDGEVDCHQIGMSGSIMDMGTGLFIHAAYGINTDENKTGGVDNENTFFYLQGGIEKKFMSYGATTLFAMYGQFDTGFTQAALSATEIGSFENGEVEMWGLGINQNFESASLDIYLKYNHYSSGADNVTVTTFNAQGNPIGQTNSDRIDFNDFDVIYAGARLTF